MTISTKKTIYAGASFGCALAIVVSYTTNKSIAWAILHGFFGWFYVLYAAINQ